MIQDIMREATGAGSTYAAYSNHADEEVLVESLRDPRIFAVIVARYEDAFLRKAESILRSREDAEEVVQDTFTRIYVYGHRYRAQEGATFSSWGYAILTRLAFTRYQKLKKRRERTLEMDPEAFERLPDETSFLEPLRARDEVLVALARLPEAARRVLSLQFLEGKTQEEIAAAEGSSVSAVKTRVHRAKKLFKNALDSTTTP
jgi:RNA polymerase sigma-70 factor, ECF subfamily